MPLRSTSISRLFSGCLITPPCLTRKDGMFVLRPVDTEMAVVAQTTTIIFQKKFHVFRPAQSPHTASAYLATPVLTSLFLNAPSFRWARAIVWYRRHIADNTYLKTGCLQCANSRLTSRTRSFNQHVYFSHALIHYLASDLLGGSLGRKRCALTRAPETLPTRTGPSQRVAPAVSYGNDRIVEGRFNVHHAFCNRTSFSATFALFPS